MSHTLERFGGLPLEPRNRYLAKFEGGPRDGAYGVLAKGDGTPVVEAGDLPSVLEIDGATYKLSTYSLLPSTADCTHVCRAALYSALA